MSKRWFRVSKVPPNTDCEACGQTITPDQQRFGQARQADDGSARHGSCEEKRTWESQRAWELRRNWEGRER